MTTPPEPSKELVSRKNESVALPAILARAGTAAVFAAEEFFYGRIRRAYLIAVQRFLAWAEGRPPAWRFPDRWLRLGRSR